MQPFTNVPSDRPQANTEYYVTTTNDPNPQVKMLEYMVKKRRYSGEHDNEGRVYEHYKFKGDDNLYVNGPESVERLLPGAFVTPNDIVFDAGIVIYRPRSNGGSKRIKQIRRKRTKTGGRRKRMNYTNKRKTNRTV